MLSEFDAITLREIRQAGVTDVVAALYERKPGVFHESQCHLVGKTNLPELMLAFLREEKRRGEGIVVRPDHGRLMEIDKGRKCYCGYSYGGRLIGLAELRGLEIGLKAFCRI